VTQTSTQELYTGEGLSLKLGTKGETVNEAKYSTGSREEA
jgi:hypothetical protein